MGSRNHTVVVVEDDVAMRESIRRLLDSHGLDVVVFGSAEELLAQPDPVCSCYLLDINLQAISGIDLCRRLKAAGRGAPVVYMTGSEDEQTRAEAVKTGYSAYLRKPFSADVLLQAVRSCVAQAD